MNHRQLGSFFPLYIKQGLLAPKPHKETSPSRHQCKVKQDPIPSILGETLTVRDMIHREFMALLFMKIDRRKDQGSTTLATRAGIELSSYMPKVKEVLEQSGYSVIYDPHTTYLLITWQKETTHE